MQFWALILIVYLIGAFLLRENFADMFYRVDGGWWVAFLTLGLIVVAFAGSIRNLLSFLSEDRHRLLYAIGALFCIGGIEYMNAEYNLLRDQQPTAALAISSEETAIQRSWDGHFRAVAQVNGEDIGLLIDTGASLVLLRHDDAIRIGFDPDDLDYVTPLTTASGRSYIAPVTIDSIRVGDLMIYNVKAGVAQQGALHSSLLGMSFIEKLDETVIQRDQLILRK